MKKELSVQSSAWFSLRCKSRLSLNSKFILWIAATRKGRLLCCPFLLHTCYTPWKVFHPLWPGTLSMKEKEEKREGLAPKLGNMQTLSRAFCCRTRRIIKVSRRVYSFLRVRPRWFSTQRTRRKSKLWVLNSKFELRLSIQNSKLIIHNYSSPSAVNIQFNVHTRLNRPQCFAERSLL